jgi:AraC-like DNA-binding protein
MAGPAQQFSTDALPEERRVALWEDHNVSELFDLRCRTLRGATLDASMVSVQLERVQLARVRGNPHVVERTADMVRRRPSDAVAVYLTLVGEAQFYHEDAMRTVRPGQLLVCDTDRPFLRGFSQGLEELVVTVPRETFRDLTGLPTLTDPLVMDFVPGPVAARTLARLVGRAVRARQAHPVEEETLLRLMSGLVTGRPDDVALVHLATARAFADEWLADPGLTAARIAEAVGISERHLSRIFSASGASVPQHILGRRLDRARELLLAEPGLTVAELAARVGLGSQAYLSHAFRDRFGERVTDVRRRARLRRPAGAPTTAGDPEGADFRHLPSRPDRRQ